MDTVNKKRGQDIQAIRLATGLSQTDFAVKLGISKRTLQQWEQGRREPQKAGAKLLELAKAGELK